jgi:glucan phosphoethanolaminetransferase (alkaline phosphatase superfamily)
MKRLVLHTLVAAVFALFFFLPDLLFKLWHSHYFVLNPKLYKEFLGFFVLNFILLAIRQQRVQYILYVIFMTFAFAELLHYSFFHGLIMPYEVKMLFSQSEEMADTLKGLYGFMLLPLFIYLLMLFGLKYLLGKVSPYTLKGDRVPLVLIVIVLMIGPIVASQRKSPYVFLPKLESSAIKNMYNVLSWSAAHEIPRIFSHQKVTTYQPYKIEENGIALPQTVIVVMGESLGAKYMSLFGFDKETTPFLKSHRDQLHYTWGYSAGVNTDVSVPTFFLLKREPENNFVFLKGETNLFGLAKEAGYTTHYITTQKLTILGGVLGETVDHLMSKKDFEAEGKHYDQVLVDYLKQVDFGKKNFIVLHQRNSHTPYDKQTPSAFYHFHFKGKSYSEYMRNSYYNSLRYTDALYKEMINVVSRLDKPAVIFFTSDHSEMLGNKDENGRFGHSYLDFADAKVPMMIYHNTAAAYLDDTLRLEGVISHYQFAKLIAQTLGKKVINPNEDGKYYINGVDISGAQGYLTYTKREAL